MIATIGTLHHIGICCTDLEIEANAFSALGYCRAGSIFEDPIQNIRGLFLEGPGERLELVTPRIPDQPNILSGWLARGTKMYHLAFAVPNLTNAIQSLKRQRAKLIVGPVPAVAFDGRLIAFLVLINMMVIELIEQP